MATAPAADGLLSLHVRAIDAGWVSSALVHHTRVGDLIRLGSPVGSMVCDPRSQRDVLLVGGGTGLAPMLALAEELSRWNDHRRVHLYFGVRRIEDLYGLDRLAALVRRDPWLRVVPCVSEDHRFRGERGVLAEVLARQAVEHDNWTRHDVFLAGSGPMVATTAGRLLEFGVDERRIRFDSFDQQANTMLDVRRLAPTHSA
jgi:NAD(P)H-flavin reductase